MTLKDIYSQFLEVFSKMNLMQKVSIVGAVFAVIISSIVLIVWANKPVYKTLYYNLNQQDAASVIEKLKERQVPYQLKDSGRTIEVPQNFVYETRIELAKEGVPSGGGAGFELFDKTSFGMTEFVQNVNYQRALQGELARTIASLNEVKEARVHLTIPKERLFISEESEAKAAVILNLNGPIDRGQVKAIASLVAGAVKGLKLENVQIVDTQGRLLSDFLNEDNLGVMLSQTQLEYTKKRESYLKNKVSSLLDSVLGAGNAVVQVSLEMDFNKEEVTKEEYDPNPVLRSQQSTEVSSTNSKNVPQGVPGVQSNLAEPDITGNSGNSQYSKTDEVQNFEVGKTVTKQLKSPGEIKRLTVAVVLNDKVVIEEVNGKKVQKFVPRTTEEVERIKNLVANAVGFNENRGDKIEVSNVSFDTTASASEVTIAKRQMYIDYALKGAKYLSAVLVFLLFYLLVFKRIIKRLGEVKETKYGTLAAVGGGAAAGKGEGLNLLVDDDIKFPKTLEELEKEIESELDESVPMDVDSVKAKVMLKKIEESANEDPEMIANLIKAWIREGGA
ncbi:flagellar M-ring protein FliF [Deferribacterales bacterium Es71-Z0220]|uniref:flagellar basal-body MS-ring/collar protein FliF n=1 Tax=Deferrivibrio essentukiensis TaxID=2880922 RepID=UPI001F624271|nr:flagellar basal-body MS-ring/collar protein FliF [Deferrivibrio essentukiensis]MCB4203749.1 flagellar M-ring protein FliF [Deferrivibrio essentukiensis]